MSCSTRIRNKKVQHRHTDATRWHDVSFYHWNDPDAHERNRVFEYPDWHWTSRRDDEALARAHEKEIQRHTEVEAYKSRKGRKPREPREPHVACSSCKFLARIEALEAQAPITTIRIKTSAHTLEATGINHAKFADLVRLATSLQGSDRNIWISGPAGSGKTTAAHKLAELLGLNFEFCGAVDSPYKFSGYLDAAGTYHSTSFRRIYENGGVILLDEVDGSSPAALLEINAATANGWANFPDKMVERHAECYVVCAANTWGFGGDANYVGRVRLDAAFLDRFVTLSWPYDENLERHAAGNDAWVNIVQQVRAEAFRLGAQVVISPRASIKGAQLLAAGVTKTQTVEAIFGRYRTHSAWQSFGYAAERYAGGA